MTIRFGTESRSTREQAECQGSGSERKKEIRKHQEQALKCGEAVRMPKRYNCREPGHVSAHSGCSVGPATLGNWTFHVFPFFPVDYSPRISILKINGGLCLLWSCTWEWIQLALRGSLQGCHASSTFTRSLSWNHPNLDSSHSLVTEQKWWNRRTRKRGRGE